MNDALRPLVPTQNLLARKTRVEVVFGAPTAMPTLENVFLEVGAVVQWGVRRTYGRGGVVVLAKLQDGSIVMVYRTGQTKAGEKFLEAVKKLVGYVPSATHGVFAEKWVEA